jgi:hypothetical protein
MWIDVGKLIREQVPDKNGKPLPLDLTMGSYQFRDLTNTGVGTLFEGKVIYDKTYGHVAYGCAVCCGTMFSKVFYDPLGVPLQDVSDDGVDGLDSCSGSYFDVSDSFYGTWSTAATSIATVDYYGTHTGVAAGSTISGAAAYLQGPAQPRCPLKYQSAKGGVSVQVPTTLSVLSDTKVIDMSHEGCSNSTYGIVIAIHYQVLDQNGKAIASSKMEPQEKINNLVVDGIRQPDPAPNWVDFGPTGYPGTAKFTDANGQTIDAPLGVCSPPGPITETATQQYSVLLNGTRYPVNGVLRTSNWTMTSFSPGHGSINNGPNGDISKSR